MRTMSSLVEMESVSANIVVVWGEMTVVIIQMNNSAVSVFLLTLRLILQSPFLWADG